MANSINRLFRRLRESHDISKKRKKSLDAAAQASTTVGIVSGCCSRRTSSTISQPINNRKISAKCRAEAPLLPDSLLFRIFDNIDNPFELLTLRRTNKNCADYVRSKIGCVTEMDLRRVNFDELSSLSVSSSCTSTQSDTAVLLQGEHWHVHPSGYKVLCRMSPINEKLQQRSFDGDRANTWEELTASNLSDSSAGSQMLRLEVLVDEQWTSREIVIICSLVNAFRHSIKRISVDAPIFELIVANLASVDLDRWFAYQCFVKAVDDGQMSATLNKLAAQLHQQQQNDPLDMTHGSALYWPNAKTIVVRTTERESVHLARVLFYGIRSNLLMDRRRLDRLALLVSVADAAIAQMSMADRPKELVRNLYHFRCWAGSPGFDDRFSQQWRSVA